ncbi:hypothetical protein SDC9_153091 [bioreactor metagenome]|uniref:Uncharacterized protein n=1 Tax=bioreactor metagenome TaxID=1076179 RepID=A0A645EVG1_9ZZZZ
MRPAQIAVEAVCVRVHGEMVLSRPVVAAEGAACLDLRTLQRTGIENKPAPSGNINDRDFLISLICQRCSPPFPVYAAFDGAEA